MQSYIRKNNGIADDAHDVFQDALMYFYNQVVKDTYDPKYTVYGYVYRWRVNRWINKLNKDKKMVFKTDVANELAKDMAYEKVTEYSEDKKNILDKFLKYIGERCVELMNSTAYMEVNARGYCVAHGR